MAKSKKSNDTNKSSENMNNEVDKNEDHNLNLDHSTTNFSNLKLGIP